MLYKMKGKNKRGREKDLFSELLKNKVRSSYLKEIQFLNLDNLWNSLCGVLSFPSMI